MKSYRKLAVLLIGLCAALLVAACAGSSSGSGGTGGNGTSTTQPTATTAKPKPTGVPHFTVQYCQQLMSLDEMNNLMKPPASATTIVPTNGDTGGACNYEVSKTNIPLVIYFFEWKGPVPIPEDAITDAIAQLAGVPGMTVNTFTEVSGIAQQAAYLETTGTGDGAHAVMHIFYVLEGPFIFDCFTYTPLSAGFLGTQDQLQQCATQVDSRL
ncbi:MAG TPA: hypothetical protein VGP82_04465 [Ktedonobacterales bacterium]|jgi:hypothetical protein|nr:hypothetical protein [Ktedonobacterales bacterium]